MSNFNEIIERLENLAKHAVHYVGEPPFVMSLDDGIALHDAIDLLKAQEPRVMTLEEIEDCDSAMWIEFKSSIYPAIYHDRHGKWLFITRKSQCWLGAEKHYADNYNKTWRCWTSHPTDDLRKAAKWDVRDE